MSRPMGEHGQGTVVRVVNPQGNPRWRTAVTMPDGRRVWRTFRTQREAERARRQLVEARELELDPTRQSLAEFLRTWIDGLAGAKNRRVRPRTLDHYRLVVEQHVIPSPLGRLKLSQVTGRKVQEWVDADESAPQTVRHHHAVLRRALNVAVRQHLIAYNPAAAVELPEVETEAARPLTADEARRLLEATAGDRLGVLWRLAIVTGLRQAELLGLSWDDVGDGWVSVSRQLQRRVTDEERELAAREGRKPRGEWFRTPPKAARKVKRVSLDAATAAALEAHRRTRAAERKPGDRWFGMVFATSNDQLYHGAEVLKAFKAACRRAGVPERRFHDLRHSTAHLLNDAGIEESVRMGRLGHNTTAMARHYGGASEAQDRAAADAIGRAIADAV